MFEKASRYKLRFVSKNGMVSTEDLWDLNLHNLNEIAKHLYKKQKDESEISFIDEAKDDHILSLQLNIVKHVISVKLEEKAKAEERVKKVHLRKQIMEELENRNNDAIKKKSTSELKEELENL